MQPPFSPGSPCRAPHCPWSLEGRGSQDQQRENPGWGDVAQCLWDLASGQPSAQLLSTYCVQALYKSDMSPLSGALSLIKAANWTASSMQMETGLIYCGIPNSRTAIERAGTQ